MRHPLPLYTVTAPARDPEANENGNLTLVNVRVKINDLCFLFELDDWVYFVVEPGVLAGSTNWQLRYLLKFLRAWLTRSRGSFLPRNINPAGSMPR
jgi:hypothetical protein